MSSTIFRRWSMNMWNRWAVPAGAAFLLFVSLAVAGRGPKKEKGPAARLREAPPWVQLLRNPYAGNEKAVAVGSGLFQQHCAQCHGTDGRGLDHAANLHSKIIEDAPPGTLLWVLQNGRIRNGMPSSSQLPDQQLWQIVTYLKALKKSH
jgi:mono/diheme cytochrome c family protein